MRNYIYIRYQGTIYAIIVCLIFLISSCSSYRDGFVKSPKLIDGLELPTKSELLEQKEILNKESREISNVIQAKIQDKQAVPPSKLNCLFENFEKQLHTDSLIHEAYRKNEKKPELKELMINSAAAYHQYFQDNKKLRRIINHGDMAFDIGKKSLQKSQQFLWAVPNREMLKASIPNRGERHTKCRFLWRKNIDRINGTIYKVAGFTSEVFGRVVAKIHAKPEPEKNIPRLMPALEKWDIIIQKSPKRATDKFIPGHFGHAAIYMGDSLFAEAIQNGAVINNPYHFAEGGSFLLIRKKNLTHSEKQRIEELVNGQIGKKYDFNFNSEYTDRLTCTELVYLVYDQFDWETHKTFGVQTIQPDHIVKTALMEDDLYFPLYFNETSLIENPGEKFIENLLKQK